MSFDMHYSLLPRPVITVRVDWVKKQHVRYLLTPFSTITKSLWKNR